MQHSRFALAICVALCSASPCLAQQGIDPAHKFSWSENCGWMNWDGGPGLGASVHTSYLTGHVWSENVGWVSLSSSTAPPNGHSFSNLTGDTFGVNLDSATGMLSGLAWSENVGWINFSGGAVASPPNPARIDVASRRFRGFAWGENIGWINFDDAASYVGLGCGACIADFDCNGTREVPDIFAFLSAWFAQDPRADVDSIPGVAVPDIFAFLTAWFAGCP